MNGVMCLHESDNGNCRIKHARCNREECDTCVEIPRQEHLSDRELAKAWKQKRR